MKISQISLMERIRWGEKRVKIPAEEQQTKACKSGELRVKNIKSKNTNEQLEYMAHVNDAVVASENAEYHQTA